MATIRQQTLLVLEHPFFAECLEKASLGDYGDFDTCGFKRLFYEVFAHSWEKCALQASKTYGNWHKANHMDIKRELRNMSPPDTLDLRLPIPPAKEKEHAGQLRIPFPARPSATVTPITPSPVPQSILKHLQIA